MQVASFFMDETEITNNEYRQFVAWVTDSIVRRMLAEAGVEGEYQIEENEYGEPLDPPKLNKKTKIRWNEAETREALNDLYDIAMQQVEYALRQCEAGDVVNEQAVKDTFIDWGDELEKTACSQGVLIFALRYARRLARRRTTTRRSVHIARSMRRISSG
jgi:formylglycine-generating enzyme required for sulfatase activity